MKPEWHLDSACSRSMTGEKSLMTELVPCAGPSVAFGNDTEGHTEGYGVVTNGEITFKRVAYVNGLKHNLISVSQLCDEDFEVHFDKLQGIVTNINKEIVLIAPRSRDVYIIDMTPVVPQTQVCFYTKASADISWLWHKRLSHNKLTKRDLVTGLPFVTFEKEKLCSACEKGKSH